MVGPMNTGNQGNQGNQGPQEAGCCNLLRQI